MYAPEQFEVALPYSAHRNPTPPMQWIKAQHESGAAQRTPETATYADDEALRQAMALTAGMIACVDDAIGEVMRCLADSGLYENTIVCFTSDHGDYLGDFNLLFKGAMPFRSIARAPFIWSDPRDRTAKRTAALASTVDIASSILERVGLKPYAGVQGQSFLANLDGGRELRDDLLVEYNDSGARLGFTSPARVRSLISVRYRLTIYGGEAWGELYDLESDPEETHNLWNDGGHAAVKAEMMFRLSQQLAGLMDESPMAQRLA